MAKVGDYVTYQSDAGKSTWRVFDIINGKVLIVSNSVSNLKKILLKGVSDYLNASRLIEELCDTYTSVELGITKNDVRSMKIEDIIAIAKGYTPPESSKRYAYYLYEERGVYGTIKNESDGETYEKVNPYFSTPNEYNWETPRFYTWDENPNTSVARDENGNGNLYAYPTEGNPVFVTKTYYDYELNNCSHKKNDSIKVAFLMGGEYALLNSTAVNATENYTAFGILAIGNEAVVIDKTVQSVGNSPNVS